MDSSDDIYKHKMFFGLPFSYPENLHMIFANVSLPLAGNFSLAKIAAYTIFGGIGFVAFIYGKKNMIWQPMVIGVALMAYPYFVSGTLAIYLVGIILTATLYFWRS